MIGVPIPKKFEMNAEPVEKAITEALAETPETPVSKRTRDSIAFKKTCELLAEPGKNALISLLKHNAKIGSKLAHEF